MNRRIVRNLFGAAVALSLTVMTTQTIVNSVQRPAAASDVAAYEAAASDAAASNAAAVQSPSGTSAQVALCAGRGKALC
jgi:hypothetical protein